MFPTAVFKTVNIGIGPLVFDDRIIDNQAEVIPWCDCQCRHFIRWLYRAFPSITPNTNVDDNMTCEDAIAKLDEAFEQTESDANISFELYLFQRFGKHHAERLLAALLRCTCCERHRKNRSNNVLARMKLLDV